MRSPHTHARSRNIERTDEIMADVVRLHCDFHDAQSISNRVVANANGELPQKGARDFSAHKASQAPIGARK